MPSESEVIFVLASGKCATTTLTYLLQAADQIVSHHELPPKLWHLGDEIYKDGCRDPWWDKLYWAARRDVFAATNDIGLIYAENNHRTGVFLPAWLRMFPKARYILLFRGFDETVYSGSRWGWYSTADRTPEGRIMPPKEEGINDSRIAVAWYWCAIYEYFLDTLDKANKKAVGLPFDWIKERNLDKIATVFEQIGTSPPRKDAMAGVLEKKLNRTNKKLEIPRIWDQYEDRAAKVTERLWKTVQ